MTTNKHHHTGLSTNVKGRGRMARTVWAHNCACCKYSTPWCNTPALAAKCFEQHQLVVSHG